MKIKYTLKAGTILINSKTQKIGIIYRKKHNDYEFPKGHLENDETLEKCAIRETAEETKRDALIFKKFKPIISKYKTKTGEHCKCFYYFAIDQKHSEDSSWDTHELIWVSKDEVSKILTHESLKKLWKKVQNKIDYIFKEKTTH